MRPISERTYALARSGNRKAKARILANHIGMVVSIAKRYGRGDIVQDFIQVGCLGVLRAIRTYNPKRDTSFNTYAMWWVRSYIGRSRGAIDKLIRTPRDREEHTVFSYDSHDDDSDEPLLDTLASCSDDLDRFVEHDEMEVEVSKALKSLDEREARIVRMRFGIGRPRLTLDQAAKVMDLTYERIRQIELIARNKLKWRLDKRYGGTKQWN